jgi:hypothetical protein
MNLPLRSIRTVVALALLSVALQATMQAQFTSDDFNSFNVKRPLWSFTDPKNDATLLMTGVNSGNATFSMTIPANTDHDLWTNGYEVPRIMQTCSNTDFTVEVKFNSGVFGISSQAYAAQGLLVEQDAQTLLRFDFTSGDNDSTRAFSASFTGGFGSPVVRINRGLSAYNVSPLWMRVQRTGTKWKMSYSLNGTTFVVADSFNYAMTVTKIGIFAANAGLNPRSHTMIADYFFNAASPIVPEDGATNVTNTIGPLIHNVQASPSSNAMVVTWKTDEPSIGSVEYGTTPSFGGSVSISDVSTSHLAVVAGLDPSTLIYYRIVGQDQASNYDVSQTYTVTTGASPGADLVSTSDDFYGPTLDNSLWTFTNPRGDATLSFNGGQMSIAIPGGISHDLWESGNFVPRIMQPVSNKNFDLIAKFTSPLNSSSNSTSIQGILIQADTANLMRFDLSNGPSGTQVYAIRFVNGLANWEIMLNQNIGGFGVAPLYLRVERDDARWYLKWSLDGATWNIVGDFFNLMNVTRVGIFTGNVGASPEAFTAKVDFFRAMRPARPRLISPANAALEIPLPVTTSWDTTTGASLFRLQIATDSLFTSTVVNDSAITGLSKQVSGLLNTTKYYWRVFGKNTYSLGPASTTFRFTTVAGPPAVPVLRSPADNATNVDTNTTIIWAKAANATSYHVQVSKDPAFGGQFVVDDTSVVDTTKALTSLSLGTKHYWRVRAKNAGGSSAFSTSRSFTTVTGIPGVPSLLLPANGSTGLSPTVTFRWTRPNPQASSYKLQVATDSTFGSGLIVNDSTLVDTFKTETGIAYGKKYFWRVNGKGVGGPGAYSAVWNFRTLLQDPSVPALLSPVDGSTGQPTNPTLRWTRPPGATSFHLQFGLDSTFATGLLIDDPAVVDTSKALVGLTYLTKYFWRLNADNVGGTSPWSNTSRFTVGVLAPSKVALLKPTNAATVGTSANFVWYKATPAVVRYWFEIAADPNFTLRVVDTTVTDTSKIYTSLFAGTQYYWKVRAWNPGGWGPYSDVWTLTASSSVGVGNERGIPTRFDLSQNYPNPFNPSTQIEFALPQEAQVKLDVYSMLGEKVMTLVNEPMTAGYHTVRFDASSLASGLYLYRITAGTFTMTRKMMLVR